MTIPDSAGCDYLLENGCIELPCKPEEESRIVQNLTQRAEANLREGNFYYVISSRWFRAWQRYTGEVRSDYPFDGRSIESQCLAMPCVENRPGPIDNSDILVNGRNNKDDDPQLVRTVEEGRDYVLVPEEVWEKLLEWYRGGPVLQRRIISVGDHHRQYSVEIYPLCLRLIDSRDQTEVVIRLSKKASLDELYVKVCRLKELAPEKTRIWDYFNKQKHEVLVSSSHTLEESNLQMDQDILLEVSNDGFGKDSTGNTLALVTVDPMRSNFSIAGGPTMSNGYSSGYGYNHGQGILPSSQVDADDLFDGLRPATRVDIRGLAGLQNLGNTCFMNSALQCLAHTPHLVEYFLQDYREEINPHNPLGMHGELALAFGDLLRKLWSSGKTPVAPRVFKGKLARFAPQFSGYNQHDSQELLAFLLDGLHEDLNRVKQKPYIETEDSDGRPDKEVADEFWRYHKARNDSIIVDICQGQYKSTLICPVCNKISITFDPFMYLSLPLPSVTTRSMSVTVFYGDGIGLPMPFTVAVVKNGSCKDLYQAMATACCLHSDELLLLAEVYDHRILRYLENPLESLTSIKDEEQVVAYRLPNKETGLTRLEICHRYQEMERKMFLTPLMTVLENPQCGADIDRAVKRVLSPLRRKSFLPSVTIDDNERSFPSSTAKEEQMKICSAQLEYTIQSIEEMKPEGMESMELSFQLYITDDKGFGCIPLMKDSPMKPGHLINVMLDWTDKEHEVYDASYLKDLPMVHKSGVLKKKTKQEAISLFSCLDTFLKEEPLGPDDMWYCPQCREHRQASKKLDLWRLPEVLVFHLKRFSYSRWLKNKLDTYVNFPVRDLDLSNYVKSEDASEGSYVYELYAISNHYGGLGGGHYSAYCKLIDDDGWYHFDDSHVSPVNESEIKTSAAYVLFYQRVKQASGGEI